MPPVGCLSGRNRPDLCHPVDLAAREPERSDNTRSGRCRAVLSRGSAGDGGGRRSGDRRGGRAAGSARKRSGGVRGSAHRDGSRRHFGRRDQQLSGTGRTVRDDAVLAGHRRVLHAATSTTATRSAASASTTRRSAATRSATSRSCRSPHDVGAKPWDRVERFTHDGEQAEPGYYAVTFPDSGVRTELTATTRTGLAAFTFPAGQNAQVLVKGGASLAGNSAAKPADHRRPRGQRSGDDRPLLREAEQVHRLLRHRLRPPVHRARHLGRQNRPTGQRPGRRAESRGVPDLRRQPWSTRRSRCPMWTFKGRRRT